MKLIKVTRAGFDTIIDFEKVRSIHPVAGGNGANLWFGGDEYLDVDQSVEEFRLALGGLDVRATAASELSICGPRDPGTKVVV